MITFRFTITTILFSMMTSSAVIAEESGASTPRSLFVFDTKVEQDWKIVSDVIMGGVSKARIAGTTDGHLVFTGGLSLRNGGGFATVRSSTRSLGLTKHSRIITRVKGDGRTYQLTLWTKGPLKDYVASYLNGSTTIEDLTNWRVSLPTENGVWIEREFSISDFSGNIMGQPLSNTELSNPESISSMGIGISDKIEGAFSLEVGHIQVRDGLAYGPKDLAQELQFSVGSASRRALVVNQASEGQLRPAVLVLHGGGGSAENQRRMTGFDEIAQREAFTVVYAEGTAMDNGGHAWNTGYMLRKQVGEADDIAYLDTLIDLLVKKHRVDPKRIYMTGGSNGAMMTFVYAVKRTEKIAAIAPVVGTMFTFDEKPTASLPVLLINGAKDNEVPIKGGISRNPIVRGVQGAPFKALDEIIDFWVKSNRSEPKADVSKTITKNGSYTTITHAPTPGGAPTVSIVDSTGGHGWPGTQSIRDKNTPIQSFKGAEKVWEFVKVHRRP